LGWLKFFKGRESGLRGNALRDVLFDAFETGDKEGFDRTCRENRLRILSEFKAWLKAPAPETLRADPKALARYGEGLITVAEWFALNGAPQLQEAIEGQGRDNPILRWRDRFSEADKLKAQGRFSEAIEILKDLAKDMSKCRGSAVERYLPMVHGSLGEVFFRSGRLDRAYEATRAALDGCQRSGDIHGLITYCGNLAEICSARGEDDEARQWLIVTTNAMIQTGEVDRAAEVRRKHRLEPATGLIEGKGPLG
jgi:tetratricopeptide (TPR) repeat protein